jgi:RNA polymerase sigma-70 factor (ECF subfamily)
VAQRFPLTNNEIVEPAAAPESGITADPVPTLRQIFDEHISFVWRSLRHLGISEADLEDVCQDVFVVVHRKLGDFEGRSTLRTWLYGICLRVAKDHRRRAYVRREHPVGELPPRAEPPTQEEDCAKSETRQLLSTILEQLDEDKRNVFILYEIEGLSMKEVADAMQCPLQTAYSRLHAARRIVLEAAKRLQLTRSGA